MYLYVCKEKTGKRVFNMNSKLLQNWKEKKSYATQNNNKLAIYRYMMLFSDWFI